MTYTLHLGDCLDVLPSIPAQSIDAVICDPPYPMIKRDYGMLTEDEWWALMMGVCVEVRRVLKPTGSAVFILQSNSRKVGSMRGWLWEFMAWVCREWNMVQDAYWWNFVALPLCGSNTAGLMRPSIKPCIWAGAQDCYRNQLAVLWRESEWNAARRAADRASGQEPRVYTGPSGRSVNTMSRQAAAEKRGGSTPFNLIPVQPDGFRKSGGASHGAVTPLELADWWTRYIVPPGGTVLDPFNGAGTMGVAALQNGARYIGIERMAKYVDVSHERLAKVQPALAEVA